MQEFARHTVVIGSTPDEVWRELVYFPHWPTWDKAIAWAEFPGALVTGMKGRFRPTGSLISLPLTIVEADPARGYASEARLGTLRMRFDHFFVRQGDSVALTFTLHAGGLGSGLFRLFNTRKIRRDLPGWMENFKRRIEARAAATG